MVAVLVVGPAGRNTGGIAQFIAEQQRALPAGSLRVYDLDVPDGEGALWFLTSVAVSLKRLAAFPLRHRPDVVHVHTSHRFSFYLSACYVLFVALVWRRPVVLHIHGSSFDTFVESSSGLRRRGLSFVLRRCSVIVVLSEYWARVVEGLVPREKLVVMPNAVHASDFDPSYRTDDPHVVFVSNLVARKGVPALVTAIEQLQADPGVPTFRVTIAGDGPLVDEVSALADRFDRVAYLGYVSEALKRDVLDLGTVYVLPSRAEGLPIGLLEGMAGGNAIVSTTVGSIPDVVDTDQGYLVEPNDADGLATALRSLIEDPELVQSMGRRNRSLVVENYSWDVKSRQLQDLYRTIADADVQPVREEPDGSVIRPVSEQ